MLRLPTAMVFEVVVFSVVNARVRGPTVREGRVDKVSPP